MQRTLTDIMNPRQSLEERFFAKVDRTGGDQACWLWTGALNRGYGSFQVGKRKAYAHRFAWALAHGPIPTGMLICHRCDNPRCCNAAHLFLGTCADNMADKTLKGRQSQGEGHGRAKLTETEVREIVAEADHGIRGAALARRFGVTRTAVCDILHGRNWNQVTGIQPQLKRAA